MIGSIEFFGLIAFTKLVDVGEVVDSSVPVRLRVVGELFTTIAACIAEGAIRSLSRGGGGRMEGATVVGDCCARP